MEIETNIMVKIIISSGDNIIIFLRSETPVLWPPHEKSWLIGKDSDAGRDWGQEGKGMTEDEMAGWHHQLDGPEFEWTLGIGDGQGGLACCNSWGRKVLHTTERLNWTDFENIYTWTVPTKLTISYFLFNYPSAGPTSSNRPENLPLCFKNILVVIPDNCPV